MGQNFFFSAPRKSKSEMANEDRIKLSWAGPIATIQVLLQMLRKRNGAPQNGEKFLAERWKKDPGGYFLSRTINKGRPGRT